METTEGLLAPGLLFLAAIRTFSAPSFMRGKNKLLEPNQLRQRLEALDRLDAYFPDTPQPVFGAESIAAGLYRRARAICARLEAMNCELYEAIRCEIQRGARPRSEERRVGKECRSR